MAVTIRPFRQEDRAAVHALTVRAFSSTPGDPFDPDRPRTDDDRRIVAVHGDRVVGHLAAWELGHHVGGRAIPAAGISSVVVAPEGRRRGTGHALLQAGLDAARTRGEPLASLFPLTRGIYRSHGFEVAGVHPRLQIETAALGRLPRPDADDLEVLPGTEDDLDEVLAFEQRLALTEGGSLVRPMAFARRTLLASEHHFLVLVRRAGALAGYLSYHHYAGDGDPHSLYGIRVDELVASDRDAILTLWHVLGAHASSARQILVIAAPDDPIHLWLPEKADSANPVQWRWMLRLLDLPAAFAARGWPDHLEVLAHLEVADPTWPANAGRWTLRVADGHAELTRGGDGAVSVDVGALAAWFSGYQSATRLTQAGRMRGADPATCRLLDALVAGPTPWVRTFF